MAYDALTDEETATGRFTKQALMRKIKDNFEHLYGELDTIGSGGISGVPNGSFEISTVAAGLPDSWDITLYTGGATAQNANSPTHGGNCLRFVHPGGAGNGGGYATSDYIEIDELGTYIVSCIHWVTNASMRNHVRVVWYDKDKVSVSAESIYLSTSNPTSVTRLILPATPPATARYVKIQLIGGQNSVDAAGNAYFDDVRILPFRGPTAGSDYTYLTLIRSGYTDSESYYSTDQLAVEFDENRYAAFVATLPGTITVSGEIQCGSTYTASVRILVNGVAESTWTQTGSGYTAKSSDIAVDTGDVIAVQLKTDYALCRAYWQDVIVTSGTPCAIAPVR